MPNGYNEQRTERHGPKKSPLSKESPVRASSKLYLAILYTNEPFIKPSGHAINFLTQRPIQVNLFYLYCTISSPKHRRCSEEITHSSDSKFYITISLPTTFFATLQHQNCCALLSTCSTQCCSNSIPAVTSSLNQVTNSKTIHCAMDSESMTLVYSTVLQ